MADEANTLSGESEWMQDAACREVGPDIFFGSRLERKFEREKREAIARTFCGSCAVRQQCLDFAIVNKEENGVWGGLNEGELKQLRKSLKQPKSA